MHLMWQFVCILTTVFGIDFDQAKVKRYSNKNGYHRDVKTEIVIYGNVPDDAICNALIVEMLPSGAYVDIYELENLLSFGGPKVLAGSDIDIEKPKHLSSPLTLQIFQKLKIKQGTQLSAQISLPVHLRYHPPGTEEFVKITINNPLIYARCSGETNPSNKGLILAPCDYRNLSQCHWKNIDYETKVDSLEFLIPVGNVAHMYPVLFITLAVTVAGSGIILCIFIKHKTPYKKQI